jgi:hypothetical protein
VELVLSLYWTTVTPGDVSAREIGTEYQLLQVKVACMLNVGGKAAVHVHDELTPLKCLSHNVDQVSLAQNGLCRIRHQIQRVINVGLHPCRASPVRSAR